MAVESLFDEDHLIPIALVENTLFVFSSLDGCVYYLSNREPGRCGEYQPVSLSELKSPFSVPGVPYIYDLVHTASLVTVHEYPLSATGLGIPRCRVLPSPPDSTHRLTSLIPDAEEATLRIVFEPTAARRPWLLMDIQSGAVRPEVTVSDMPKCLLADGTLVTTSNIRWSMVLGGTVIRQGPGAVIATASDFVVVRKSNKSGIWFSVVRTSGESDIVAPSGWTLVSLAASDKKITAYAIHSKQGQRLLQATPDGLSFTFLDVRCGTSQVFAMGAEVDPLVRSTGIRIGSLWQAQTNALAGIAPSREDLSLDYITPAGLPCVYVCRHQSNAKEIIVSLHGGPDSHELDDLRYGGIYRNLLDVGFDVLIVNYPGSKGFGTQHQQQAWKNWGASIQKTADAIREVAAARGLSDVSILGVSFGAWIGLQLSNDVDTLRLVAMSPILDLAHHLQLHEDDDETFRSWAEERFERADLRAQNGEEYVENCRTHVVVIAPDKDEVVLPVSTQNSVLSAKRKGRQWTTMPVSGSHYPRTSAEADQRWTTLSAALTTAPAARECP